jgi:hypothetical protein
LGIELLRDYVKAQGERKLITHSIAHRANQYL